MVQLTEGANIDGFLDHAYGLRIFDRPESKWTFMSVVGFSWATSQVLAGDVVDWIQRHATQHHLVVQWHEDLPGNLS